MLALRPGKTLQPLRVLSMAKPGVYTKEELGMICKLEEHGPKENPSWTFDCRLVHPAGGDSFTDALHPFDQTATIVSCSPGKLLLKPWGVTLTEKPAVPRLRIAAPNLFRRMVIR